MAGNRRIGYDIEFNINKSSINSLMTSLRNVQQEAFETLRKTGGIISKQLNEASDEATKLELILNKAWDSKLNQFNLRTLNKEIKEAYGGFGALKKRMSELDMGEDFLRLDSAIHNTNLELKQSNKLLNEMATTFANTIRFGLASSIYNRIANEIQRAYQYSIKLDSALTDIRIVSDKSAKNMADFAVQANKAAKELGSSTLDYVQASTIYYQQGLSDEEVAARTETTLKAANVTGQAGEEVSEQLTAIWNGYKVTAQESELYIDKVSKVAASTAADLEEMATGMSKVASAANSAGVDIDQLNATLSTVISVTREAPETIGTAFKTIYARMGDLALGGTDETGVTLGNVSKKMAELGVQILDQNGNMRDMGTIIEDTAKKWQTWTQAQKQAAAVAMAGKMQYSRLIALFDNWDMYTKALHDSQSAAGTLQEQQDKYMESTESHLQRLRTEAERTYDILFDKNVVDGMTDALNGLLTVFNNFLSGFGGGISSVAGLVTMIGAKLNKQIGSAITNRTLNKRRAAKNEENLQVEIQRQDENLSGLSDKQTIQAYEEIQAHSREILGYVRGMTSAEYNKLNTLKEELLQLRLLAAKYKEVEESGRTADAIKDDTKQINAQHIKLKANMESLRSVQTELSDLESSGSEDTKRKNDLLKKRKEILKDIQKLIPDADEEDKSNINTLVKSRKRRDSDVDIAQNIANNQYKANENKLKENQEELKYREQIAGGASSKKSTDDANKKAEELKKSEEELRLNQANANVVQTLNTGLMALISLQGAIRTGLDENLSLLEKTADIATNFLFILPAIVSTLKDIRGFLPGLAIQLGAQNIAMDSTAKAALSAQVSVLGFNGSLKALLLTLGKFLAIGAVIAVIIWGLVKVANAASDAAKKANEYANEATEAADKASEQYNKLTESLSSYEEAVEGMKQLTYGTEEYKESLEKANAAAIELINSNSELASKATRNAQGLIEFEGLNQEDIKRMLAVEKNTAAAAANIATINANNKLITAKKQDMSFNGLKGVLEEPDLLLSDLASELKSNTKKLESTQKSIDELNNTNKLLIDETLRTVLENNPTYAELNDAEKTAVVGIYKKGLTEEKQNEMRKEIESEINKEDEKSIKEEYAKSVGKTYVKDNTYIDNSSGEEQTVSFESVKALIANQRMTKKIADYDKEGLNNAIDVVEEVSKFGESISGTMSSELLGFLSGEDKKFDPIKITSKEMEALTEKIKSGEFFSELQSVSDEQWKKMGFSGWKEFANAIFEGRSNFTADFESEIKLYSTRAKTLTESLNVLSEGDESKLSKEQISNLEQYEARYKELERLSKDAGRSSHEYLTLLRKIREIEEEDARQSAVNKKKKYQDIVDEYNEKKKLYEEMSDGEEKLELQAEITADTEKVEEAMKKIQEADYEITVQVNADVDSDISEAFNLADEFEQLQDAVADDLTYTFDEAQELIKKGYGDIFKNAKATADNQIQVQKDVMNAAIDAKQTELEEDKKLRIGQLQNEDIYLAAQEQALEQKLAALQEAYKASNEADVNSSIEKVKNADAAYQSATEALQKELNSRVENANESENVNKDLYDSLGGMYEQDAMNEENAEKQATDNQKANISARIQNVRALHEQYSKLAEQVAASEDGKTVNLLASPALVGGVTVEFSSSKKVDKNTHTAKQLTVEDIKSKAVDLFNTNKVQYQDTINQLIKSTTAELKSVKARRASISTAIASLNSASMSLDKKQANAKLDNGGSGSDAKDPDQAEYLQDEKDIYHDINIELELLSNELDKIQKQKDKLFGQDLINNINKQIEILNKQIAKTNEKIRIARDELNGLRNELSQGGVLFNADGTIANYANAYNTQLEIVNEVVSQYNGMSAEAQESFKDTLDASKENFEAFVSNMEKYDELITSTIPSLESDIQDAIDSQIEMQIEKFNMEIEIRLDLSQAERDWNSFKAKVIDRIKEDDILGNAKAKLQDFYSYYKENETGVIQRNTAHVNDILNQLEQINKTGTSSVYGNNKNQALEDLKNYYDQLMTDLQDIEDLQKEIHDSYIDMLDEAQDRFDRQVDLYEQITDLIEHDISLIQLTKGENSYEELSRYYELQADNYLKELDFQRQQKDFWKAQMDAAEENSDEWENAKEKWIDAVDSWNSTVESAVENIQDKYLNAINMIFKNLNNQVTDGLGLDYIKEEWELIGKKSEEYLDTVNAIYGVQQLSNKYKDALDNTDSLSGQKKLNSLMEEELKALEQKDKLTQYDLDRANLRYEIALKQIALEEAQQNKSSMRLRRDSQGNYSYQFVADQDEISKLQQEISDLYNQLYNLDLEKYKDNLDKVYTLWEEYQQKMLEAAQINDPEEREQRELLLKEQYGELINGLVEQNEQIRNNMYESTFLELIDFYNNDTEAFNNSLGEKFSSLTEVIEQSTQNFFDFTDKSNTAFENMTNSNLSAFQEMDAGIRNSIMNSIIPQWDSGISHMIDKFAGSGGFKAIVMSSMEEIRKVTSQYQDDLNRLQDAANVDFNNISNGIDNTINETSTLLQKNNELISNYENQLNAIRNVIRELDTLINKYNDARNAAIEATKAAYEHWRQENEQAAESARREAEAMAQNSASNNVSEPQQVESADSGSNSYGGYSFDEAAKGIAGNIWVYKGWGDNPTRRRLMKEKFGEEEGQAMYNSVQGYINSGNYFPLGKDWQIYKRYSPDKFDTGGYTGDWGDSSGRLALLHSKELVLNKEDTQNLLNAVQALNGIMDTIGVSMLSRLASLKDSIGIKNTNISKDVDSIEQNVRIEATFPGVQNSKEIEDALNNLVNRASQRVYRR